MNGDNPAIIHVGDTYADLSATIISPQADLNLGIKTFLNGKLVSNIVIDTSSAATDTIDYVATDSAGFTFKRKVIVRAPDSVELPTGASSNPLPQRKFPHPTQAQPPRHPQPRFIFSTGYCVLIPVPQVRRHRQAVISPRAAQKRRRTDVAAASNWRPNCHRRAQFQFENRS